MSTAQKASISQVTIMLATSKDNLFQGHNHLLTNDTDDPTLWLLPERQQGWYLKYRVINIGG